MTNDTERLDWLERNLVRIYRDLHGVDMGNISVRGQLVNEARGAGAGPSYFRVAHTTIREAIDAAMAYRNDVP